MKASKLIEKLQRNIEQEGDLEVVMWENSFEEWYMTTVEDIEIRKQVMTKFETKMRKGEQRVFCIIR